MNSNAYILSIPKSLDLDTILRDKPELRSYPDDESSLENSYKKIEQILDNIKNNVENDMTGDVVKIAIMYFIIEYAQEHNELLGEIKIPGNIEKIFNIEASEIKDDTKNNILQKGLLSCIRRMYGL